MSDSSKEIGEKTEGVLFKVTKELTEEILAALAAQDRKALLNLLGGLHDADLAQVISSFGVEERKEILKYTQILITAEMIIGFDPVIRQEAIECIGLAGLAGLAEGLGRDSRAKLVQSLSEEQQKELIHFFPREERYVLEQRLSYPEGSAGRVMQREIVVVPSYWTVEKVGYFLRTLEKLPEDLKGVYVVESRHVPIGFIPLGGLLRFPATTPVTEIMEEIAVSVPVTTTQEEVAYTFRHYGLSSVTVVDEVGRLLGIIATEQVVHILGEEVDEALFKRGGVRGSDFYATYLSTWYKRVGWLMVTLINTFVSVMVLSWFKKSIEQMALLAVLMPIVSSMAGSSGMQVATVMVRAIAMRELQLRNVFRTVTKEIAVSFLHSGFFAIVLMGVFFWFHGDVRLAAVLVWALAFSFFWSSIIGVLLPFILERFGMDPAVSAGPILSALTDIIGFGSFLGLATLLLL